MARRHEFGKMTRRSRHLTVGEIALARSMFGDAIDYAGVTIRQRKWAFFQPRETVMAPSGHLHFHPLGSRYRDDFAAAPIEDQGLFIHEMTHVWQHQRGLFLPLRRHPFCRYAYALKPGQPFDRYGIEQQAEIVRHAFLLRRAWWLDAKPPRWVYEALLPFGG